MRARLAACDRYDLARYALLLILAVLALATYDSYAVSNDEGVQQRYGELILAYYASGFADEALFHYANLYLYGGLFDVTAVICERLLPFLDPYAVRHLLCAITGIAGVAATAATARLVAGARAGAIAAFVLAVCGTWYGAMFNHTKDIPFAAAMMGAMLVLIRIGRRMSSPSLTGVLALGLLTGTALGLHNAGLLYGRRNVLLDGSRRLLAEVIEVLAPVAMPALTAEREKPDLEHAPANGNLADANYRDLKRMPATKP